MMKRIYRLLGLIIGSIATIAFAIYAIKKLSIDDFSRYITPPALTSIAIAILLYITIIPMNASAWRKMLADLGIAKSWRELTMIMAITQMAKYLPGNVGQHIGRGAMSIARGISIRPFIFTVFAETLLTLFAGTAIGLLCLLFSPVALDALKLSNQAIALIVGTGIIILGLMIYRPLVKQLIRRFAPRYAESSLDEVLPFPLTLLRAFATYSLNYLMIGAGLWLMSSTLIPGIQHNFILLLCSFSLAWIIGFVTPGAPAGLGVREAVMLGILSASYSGENGLIIVIGLRLVTVLGDSLCFLVGYGMLLLQRNKTTLK
ncbi:lysylphosphatidylglycerol synthase transmembrane domain-containing protein [Glaciimonas soli]|uniref:Flippase-like domain-containing protein n=1 Tax=Glaciimonas soli TaxID=2590999 RepID=A0A843YQF9_9BURK|nr:YbhN family protein [Glaciimonas soli]MQR01310.1 hypothetical protein [Glaciimonas soli]